VSLLKIAFGERAARTAPRHRMIHGQVAAQRTHSSDRRMAETASAHGCSVVLRRVAGPGAGEVFLHCRPPSETTEPGQQAAAMYRAILAVLEAEGGSFRSVVAETMFVRNLPTNIESIRDARRRVLAASDAAGHRPATIAIEQPPLEKHACLELSLHAVLPGGSTFRMLPVVAVPACDCAECASAHGLRVDVGAESRFHAAGLCGPGDDAYEQTLGMFGLAESLLQKAGMEFRDVARTWIHLRHMERDYRALNRARREFFAARGIDPVPASTGIGGAPVSGTHDLCLSVNAVKCGHRPLRTVMTSPTLNEAREYGADFVRGMRVDEANKIALHISGTASIDEHGRTAHRDDLDAQVDRMLLNVVTLLEGQGAGPDDVVHAITYVKHADDAERVRQRLRAAGFTGFPHAIVEAEICRPELLCETEALGVLPKPAAAERPGTTPRG
jgi:enamine deaminase RidA (YjgF/YER057c/UK114 family)